MFFNFLDQVALWYTSWRIDRKVKNNPEIQGFELHKAKFDGSSFHAIGSFPGVVLLADGASRMLDASNCENYLEFDMMPRVKKGMRGIRVTVQWIQPGLSPAQKVVKLEEEMAELQKAFEDICSLYLQSYTAQEFAILKTELGEAYERIIELQDQVKGLLELSIKTVEEMTKEVNEL